VCWWCPRTFGPRRALDGGATARGGERNPACRDGQCEWSGSAKAPCSKAELCSAGVGPLARTVDDRCQLGLLARSCAAERSSVTVTLTPTPHFHSGFHSRSHSHSTLPLSLNPSTLTQPFHSHATLPLQPVPVRPPMLLKIAHEVPRGPGWAFEAKSGGYRAIVSQVASSSPLH
jgi:hypothetical protein